MACRTSLQDNFKLFTVIRALPLTFLTALLHITPMHGQHVTINRCDIKITEWLAAHGHTSYFVAQTRCTETEREGGRERERERERGREIERERERERGEVR